MLELDLSQAGCNRPRKFGIAPNGADDHYVDMVVLQMATFIAINVENFRHFAP